MYHPPNAGYNQNAPWQQGQPPLPQGGPPPPPPQAPMSAEAAAAYKNYGYGNVAPRPGNRNTQAPYGRGPQAQAEMYPAYPPAQPPMLNPGQPAMGHPHPGAPYPPAKRAKYDSKGAASPVYMQNPTSAGLPAYPGQPYQAVSPYQNAPQQPQQPMGALSNQHYYPQQAYVQPAPIHAGLPQPVYQYQPQIHQPMSQPHHQHTNQPYQAPDAHHPSAPPLAVALMKATPMASSSGNSGGKNNSHNHMRQQPPPPASPAPLPPPPSDSSLPSGPKGLASLPDRPMSASLPPNPIASASAAVAPDPNIPTGPSSFKTAIKRDTRPLPSQSRHVEANLRGSDQGSSRGVHAAGHRGKAPPTGPSRGGGRGGRGGRGGFDGSRGPNRQQFQQARRDDRSEQNREKGYKRNFSQTGPPANTPRGPASRPRTNSNATVTSASVPPASGKKGQANQTKKRERNLEGSPAPSSAGKALKRTLTDFRIDSLEIPSLDWSWKATPLSQILAKMNLKESEEHVVKEDVEHASAAEERTNSLRKVDETAQTSDIVVRLDEGQPEYDSSVPEGISKDLSSTAPSGADMQRSDSRPEKRKHARDEDEEDEETTLRHAASEDAKDVGSHPVGKKVKSEVAVTIAGELSEPAVEAILQQETTREEIAEKVADGQSVDAVPIADHTEVPTAATHQTSADDETSDADESADEVADSIIASRSQDHEVSEARPDLTPTHESHDAHDVSTIAGTAEEPNESIIVHDALEGKSLKPTEAVQAVPKKAWENSRLRIYFMSPVELEQKDARQYLLQKQKEVLPAEIKSESKAETDDSIKEEVADTTTDEAEATPSKEESADTESKQEEQDSALKSEVLDELDGEPLPEEAAQAEVNEQDTAAGPVTASGELPKAGESVSDASRAHTEPELPEQDPIRSLSLPSADRLSIAYAQNTRRLVVDAEVVDEVALYRAEGKIEITLRAEPPSTAEEGKGFRCAKGVYVEKALATGEPAFAEIGVQDLAAAWSAEGATPTAEAADEDSASTTHLSPPLHRLFAFEESETDASGEQQVQRITIVARMDREHPLTEAKWVRTGNPDEWIQSVIGNSGGSGLASSIGGTRAAQQLPKGEQGKTTHLPSPTSVTSTNYRDNRGSSAWKGKIRVVDPDAPPTFQHALENWLSNANSRHGFDEARYRFVETYFQDINNVLEVLLRLIRGVGNNTSNSNAGSSSGAPNADRSGGNGNANSNNSLNTNSSNNAQSASLAAQALSSGIPFPESQTSISLATFQIFKFGIDSALKNASADEDKNNNNNNNTKNKQRKKEIERKIGEIIRNLPYSLIFKSLDSIFIDYKRSLSS